MKKIILLTSLLSAGIAVSSCTSDDNELFGSKNEVKKIEALICDFEEDADGSSTRTSYTYVSGTGYEAVWTEGDILGIYPLGGDQVSFPISKGAGSKTAFFDGGAWALRGTYKYAAYYPFSTDNYTIKETSIPVSYIGQEQKGNNTTAHLSAYDFMAAAATKPSSNGSVTLPFKHLDLIGSTIEIKVTDSDGVSYIN